MKLRLLAFTLCAISAVAQQPCRKFSVVWQDDLGNQIAGFPDAADAKFQHKLVKKYPHVCADKNASTIFVISSKPAVYHGVKTSSSSNDAPLNGTIVDSDGNTSTIDGTLRTTTESTAPYSVDYKLLYLTIGIDQDGKFVIVHSVAGKTIHPTMYGLCTRNCHPTQALIEHAVKWLSDQDVIQWDDGTTSRAQR